MYNHQCCGFHDVWTVMYSLMTISGAMSNQDPVTILTMHPTVIHILMPSTSAIAESVDKTRTSG